jgi:DNA-binding response OmpR family regulator
MDMELTYQKYSGNSLTGNKGLVDKVRATDYLTKPFNAKELLAMIGKYL